MRDPPPFESTTVLGSYDADLRRLIQLLKYERMRPLATRLGRSLGARVAAAGLNVDVVIPVPLHWRRRLSREFNQAALIARELAVEIDSECKPYWLRRLKATAPQAGLTDRERIQNVRGAFRAAAAEKVRGRRVLIVDDVMTTGSTLSACARAVKRAGAESVVVAALARAHRERLVS